MYDTKEKKTRWNRKKNAISKSTVLSKIAWKKWLSKDGAEICGLAVNTNTFNSEMFFFSMLQKQSSL